MNDWQIGVMFAFVTAGSIFGGLLGYAYAHKRAKPEEAVDFDWADVVITTYLGLVAAAGWWAITDLSNVTFNTATVVGGIFTGIGLTYTVKKTILP